MTATVPAGLTGTVPLTVATPGGTSSPSTNAVFTYVTVTTGPVITSITPTVIQSGAAYFLMVYGSGFSGTTEILVGSLVVTSFDLVSDGQLEIAQNGGNPGTVDVQVLTAQGESPLTPADQLTFVAVLPAPTGTGISPNNGSSAGGTIVIITGANLTGVSQVFFGGLVAASFTVESSTTIQATTPASPAGTVDVTVVSPGGTSTTSLADLYTFTTANPLTPLAVTPSAAVTLDPAVSSVRPWYHYHAHHHRPVPERRDDRADDKRDSSDRDTDPMADVDAYFAEHQIG